MPADGQLPRTNRAQSVCGSELRCCLASSPVNLPPENSLMLWLSNNIYGTITAHCSENDAWLQLSEDHSPSSGSLTVYLVKLWRGKLFSALLPVSLLKILTHAHQCTKGLFEQRSGGYPESWLQPSLSGIPKMWATWWYEKTLGDCCCASGELLRRTQSLCHQ